MRIFQKTTGIVLIVAALGLSSAVHAAEPKDVFEPRTFEGAEGAQLKYRLMKPADYDAKMKYPLVLFLHGAGERGDDNAIQLIHGMADFSSDENRKKYPCFVVAPQCPTGKQWAEFRRRENAPKDAAAPAAQLMPLVESLQKEFSLDSRRLYVTGLSMGGYGTWDLIARYPERFAAAVPICGGGQPEHAGKFARLPIWVFHGAKDEAVPPQQSRDMVEALKKAGGKPRYTEYEDVGHDSWVRAYHDPMLLEWMFAQKRD